MEAYSFRMTWQFAAPIEKVWDMINQPEVWPKWWRNCRNVERLSEGDSNGIGAIRRFTMQTQLPYKLQFAVVSTRSQPPQLLEGSVTGNLEGSVRWELAEGDGSTTVRYYWDVSPTKAWMRTLSPVVRPVFVWNHRSMMKNAAKGFAKMMNAPLVREEYR